MDIWHTGGCNVLQPRHSGFKRLKPAKNKLTQYDFTSFSIQVSANSHNFRFRSLGATTYSKFVTSCRHICQFYNFFEYSFWLVFDFWPCFAAAAEANRGRPPPLERTSEAKNRGRPPWRRAGAGATAVGDMVSQHAAARERCCDSVFCVCIAPQLWQRSPWRSHAIVAVVRGCNCLWSYKLHIWRQCFITLGAIVNLFEANIKTWIISICLLKFSGKQKIFLSSFSSK